MSHYFLETIYIEDGNYLDLISIGITSDSGEEFYAVNEDCNFKRANEWILSHIVPELPAASDRSYIIRKQSMQEQAGTGSVLFSNVEESTTHLPKYRQPSYWMSKAEIKKGILDFCTLTSREDILEFWSCESTYTWSLFCMLFEGKSNLPLRFPKYCKDLQQYVEDKIEPCLASLITKHLLNLNIYYTAINRAHDTRILFQKVQCVEERMQQDSLRHCPDMEGRLISCLKKEHCFSQCPLLY